MNRIFTPARLNDSIFDFARDFFGDKQFDLFPVFDSRRNSGLSNVSENENEYLIELSAPGLKKEDIKIELDGDVLKISSEFEDNKEETNDGYYRREFRKSSFERNFSIPKNGDKNEISASMEDGILTVIVPKVKEEKKKDSFKITIK